MLPDSLDSVNVEFIEAEGTKMAIPGAFRSFTSRCLTLTTREPIAVFLAVSAEYNDTLFVGEVIACGEESYASFRVEIDVKHTLTSLQSLIRLRTELLGEQPVKSTDCPNVLRSVNSGFGGYLTRI
ncbi:MAG: hypothetical protein M3Y72_02050 [Acidobacteriota bacterium]|nr:hypothetical protein [Acidobacteriota bacterium]